MKHIVIVGGGFAGIKVARELRNVPGAKITIISSDPEFRYSPALYRTATGARKRVSSISIDFLINQFHNAEFMVGTVTSIDRQKRQLTLKDGQTVSYDYCVMALGVITSYFGIPGLKTFSYSIKSGHEVERLKRHLHHYLTTEKTTDKNYVVVGAGPTGVELSAELGAYLRRIAKYHKISNPKVTIELIEAMDRVLPTMTPRASKMAHKHLLRLGVLVQLGKKVERESRTSLQVSGRSIPTHTVVWTAGVTQPPFFKANADQFPLDERGRVMVNSTLQVDDHLYVLGDNVAVKYSGLALTAVRQARYVGRSLRGRLRFSTKPRAFRPTKPIYAVPVGTRYAVVEWFGLAFDGLAGGLLRSLADLVGYADIMGWWRAIQLWMTLDEYEETCPVCKSPQVTP